MEQQFLCCLHIYVFFMYYTVIVMEMFAFHHSSYHVLLHLEVHICMTK